LKTAFGMKSQTFAGIISDEEFLPEELRGVLITNKEYRQKQWNQFLQNSLERGNHWPQD